MKLVIFLLALGVCINAASIIPHPSASALLVTELLEVTFHVPADVAQAIGHIFRDVPISLAKEMIAFVVKVFGDLTSGHLAALNQYLDQALHIFSQVINHINVKEVAALIAEEVLPANVVQILQKIFANLGKRDLQPYIDDLVDAVNDWFVDTVNNLVTSVVTGFFGLFGKRNEKGQVVDAAVDALITGLTNLVVDSFNSLLGWIGKRGIVGTFVVNWAVNALVDAVFGVFGKRSLIGDVVDAAVDALIAGVSNFLIGTVSGWFGKRALFDGSILTNIIVSAVLNIFGKRSLIGDVVDAAVDALITGVSNILIGTISSWIGKRQIPNGF